MAGMFCGLVAVGMVYILMSFLVKLFGVNFIKKLFPPIVIGPVIILIGLSLAGTGVDMASKNWVLALVSLFVAIICSCWGKGMVKLIPVVLERSRATSWPWYSTEAQWISPEFASAPWFQLPHFSKISLSWQAIVFMAPVAIAPIIAVR